jgi:signal peptidase II
VFGLRLGNPYVHLALSGVALVVVCVLLWRLPREERMAAIGLALVLGGAIGNVIDRVRIGEVIDFLDFGFGSTRWWIFNLADTWVSVGTGLLILSYEPKRKNEIQSDDAGGSVTT